MIQEEFSHALLNNISYYPLVGWTILKSKRQREGGGGREGKRGGRVGEKKEKEREDYLKYKKEK